MTKRSFYLQAHNQCVEVTGKVFLVGRAKHAELEIQVSLF